MHFWHITLFMTASVFTRTASTRIQFKKYIPHLALISTSMIMLGCTSLGPHSGSLASRSHKLSNGIQKAYSVPKTTADRVSPMIIQSADQQGVAPLMLAAMIRQESSYRSNVVSPAGAVGLTQVMPRYWQQKCPGNLYDEWTNISCGTYILASYNQSAGSWKKALAYYNVGPTGYNNSWKMKRQGKHYARQVKQHQKNLKSAL